MNKPVAWMSEFGQFIGKVQDEICRIPLYNHPANACKHGVDDGACKECYLEATHPVKELTQNIMDIYRLSDQSIQIVFTSCRSASEFVEILRKASEK